PRLQRGHARARSLKSAEGDNAAVETRHRADSAARSERSYRPYFFLFVVNRKGRLTHAATRLDSSPSVRAGWKRKLGRSSPRAAVNSSSSDCSTMMLATSTFPSSFTKKRTTTCPSRVPARGSYGGNAGFCSVPYI